MSKTPISTLQEYMAKQSLDLPVYDLVDEKNGTHLASFTYRVKCGTLSAVGTASNKKEAKHNAARHFLNNLRICDNNLPTARSLSDSPSKNTHVNSYYQPGSDAISQDDIFVNSIGKLNEHCSQHQLLTPQYEVRNMSGPSHMMNFTITCSIGKLTAQATATTKKQAKHSAAQNMLQLLVTSLKNKGIYKFSDFEKGNQTVENKLDLMMLDLKIEQPKVPVLKSSELAKELFPKLRLRDSVKIVNTIEVNEYHQALRESIDPCIRDNLRKELLKISSFPKHEILKRITKLMNTKVETTTLTNTRNGCAVDCKLDCIPMLTEIGIGTTVYDAEEKAISNLLTTINLLLK